MSTTALRAALLLPASLFAWASAAEARTYCDPVNVDYCVSYTVIESAGDGDGYPEPNETISFTPTFINRGSNTFTSLTGTMPDATPTSVTFPGVGPAGSTTANGAFSYRIGPAATCGTDLTLSLFIDVSGIRISEMNIPVKVGSPGASQTFAYTGPVVAIPDAGSAVTAAVDVSGMSGGLFGARLLIDGADCTTAVGATTVGIDHTQVGDLRLRLLAPIPTSGGTTAFTVANRVGGSGNNFCQTRIGPAGSAAASIADVTASDAPFSSDYYTSALDVLYGISPNGTWQLEVRDYAAGETGSLRAFSLEMTPAVCDAPASGGGGGTIAGGGGDGGGTAPPGVLLVLLLVSLRHRNVRGVASRLQGRHSG